MSKQTDITKKLFNQDLSRNLERHDKTQANISTAYDDSKDSSDYPYIIDVEDIGYNYASEFERDSDYQTLKDMGFMNEGDRPIDKGKPEYGQQYRLTGKKGIPAISNGNTWAESKIFKCPSCDKELDNVRVYSECWQLATLKGNSIDDYGSVQELTETIAIECPHCGYDFYPKGEIIET